MENMFHLIATESNCKFLVATLSLIHFHYYLHVIKLSYIIISTTQPYLKQMGKHTPLQKKLMRQTTKNSMQHNVCICMCLLCSALGWNLAEHLLLHPGFVPFSRIFIGNENIIYPWRYIMSQTFQHPWVALQYCLSNVLWEGKMQECYLYCITVLERKICLFWFWSNVIIKTVSTFNSFCVSIN